MTKISVDSHSCEFGYELLSVLPYAYNLHSKGLLDKSISGFDTKCLYFFNDKHEEKQIERSWNSVVKLQNEKFPNMKIHRRELDWEFFSPPPFKEFYSDKKIQFEKETIVIFNRFNSEWGKNPINFLDLNTLQKLFEMLSPKYQIVYLNLNHDKRYFDHFKPKNLGDESVLKKFPNVLTFQKLKSLYPKLTINELQCRIFANCQKYISSNGGQLILSAYFGGENIIFSKECNELNPEVNSFYGWYHKLGGGVFQHVNSYTDLLEMVKIKWIDNKPLVNILIRTSNRPEYFRDCINSIYSQTYKNINIIVGVDTDQTYNYVKKDKCRIVSYKKEDFEVPTKPNSEDYGHEFIPNSYMNKLMDECKYGYIMYLDDDDVYQDNQSLEFIVSKIQTENDLLFWKVQFPHRVVPAPSKFRQPPELTQVDTVGFMFPVKYRVDWEPFSNGDFRVAKQLYKNVPFKRYIDKILTKVQRNVKLGRGLRDDKKDNVPFVSDVVEKNQRKVVEKKKLSIPTTEDQNLKMKVEKSNSEKILESKLDLKSIVPPQKLNQLLESKLNRVTQIVIETEKQEVEVKPIKKIVSTSPPEQKNLIIQQVLNKRKSVPPKVETNEGQKKEVKKLNQINYDNLNTILEKKPNIKIDRKENLPNKNPNLRNEVFEIKQRQVHREKTHQKTIGGETKPKLNIRIR